MLGLCIVLVLGSFCLGITSVFVAILSKRIAFLVATLSVTCYGGAILVAAIAPAIEGFTVSTRAYFGTILATAAMALAFVFPGLVATLAFCPLHRGANSDLSRCEHCGYNLTGLTEPRCPECGTPFPRILLTSGREDSCQRPAASR